MVKETSEKSKELNGFNKNFSKDISNDDFKKLILDYFEKHYLLIMNDPKISNKVLGTKEEFRSNVVRLFHQMIPENSEVSLTEILEKGFRSSKQITATLIYATL